MASLPEVIKAGGSGRGRQSLLVLGSAIYRGRGGATSR
jgi:hypothetical protein